jgi:hypothetical protein
MQLKEGDVKAPKEQRLRHSNANSYEYEDDNNVGDETQFPP